MRNYRMVVRKHELIDYEKREFFAVNHNYYDYDKTYPRHWHKSIELTYVVKGEKLQTYYYQDHDDHILATAGTLLLVNSGISHEIIVKKGLEGIVLLIDEQVIKELYPNCIICHFDLDKDQQSKNSLVNYMIDLAHAKDTDQRVEQNIIVLKIIDLLVEKLISKDNIRQEKHDEITEVINSVMEYIEHHFYQQITLDDIAGFTNYNKTYLSSLFKRKMGITIFQYLKNIRLQHCLQELKETDETIVNIALKNGFASIQSFNKVFKEIYQMTPAQYRKTKYL